MLKIVRLSKLPNVKKAGKLGSIARIWTQVAWLQNLGSSSLSESLRALWPACIWINLPSKTPESVSFQQLRRSPQSPPCRGSLGSIYVCAEKKEAGKSRCSPLLTCAPPPQLSTSSALIFSQLGALTVKSEYRHLRKGNSTSL